jgi:TOMM system kinase/cyclase fusion protein
VDVSRELTSDIRYGWHGDRVISVGDIFQGRYEVLSKLSEGGFGEVFQARQLTTGQLVALKTLRQQHFDYSENQLARFRREVQLCATLHHPHIVGLIDFGTTETDLLYIVFEYVPGRTLSDVLAGEGSLPIREAVRLMAQVLDALSCAHQAGIVHRDLKPGNIMIMSTGARRNAKVLDFGIGAILPSASEVEGSRLTGSFEQLGTPAYTAPEQLRGQPVPASDLYVWGLVLLECLTGQRAVPGRSAAELIHEQLSPQPIEIPTALQTHQLGKLLRLVTTKNVEQRQITTDDLLRQLESCNLSGIELPHLRRQRLDEPMTVTTRVIGRADEGAQEPAPQPGSTGLGDTPRDDLSGTSERRQITAVCCSIEIVGGEAANIDFEDHDALMSEQQARCRKIAERFSGHVASVLGHQVLLCYGYPVARADDARRAALSSLAILDELAAESARLEQSRGISLETRIGIHTGLVVAHTLQRASESNLGNVLGNTPAVALRLNALAAPGSIAISEITRRLLGTDFAVEPLQEPLQGRTGRSMLVFRLGRPQRAATGQPSTDRMGVALVGRDEELALLRQRWHQSRQGMGQVILVTGEAGIGKSRLVGELLPMIQDQPHVQLQARCTPEGQNSPLRPVIELLALHMDLHEGMSVESKRERLEDLLVRYHLDPASYLPLVATLLDIPPGEQYPLPQVAPQRQKSMTLEAVIALVSVMASEDPVLLGIEDMHWADPTTIELLSLLIEEAPTTPICVVMTARPEFSPPWRAGSMTQIQLGRMEQDAVRQMVLRIAKDKDLPRDVVDKMIRRTDGIPLFVEELTRTILESGALEEHESSYELVGTLSDLDIPPTLRDSLMARLDRLGPIKATAQLAAVIGREFELDLLTRISPLDQDALREALSQLTGAGIIHRRRRLEGDLYLFKHALLREIAYESLLKSSRREHHARIAEALEQHAPEVASTRPELLAHHYAGAQQIVKAVTYAEHAAQLALQRFANAEAIAYMRQALTWLEGLKDQKQRNEIELRCNMFLIQALSLVSGGGTPEIHQLIERCQTLVDEIGDRASGFFVLIMLCMYHQMWAHHQSAAELARRCLEQSDAEDNPLYRMDALRVLGLVSHYMGHFQEAREYLEQSIALYDSLGGTGFTSVMGLDQKLLCQTSLSFVLWAMGYPDQALAKVEAFVESSKTTNSIINLTYARVFLAGLRHFQGQSEPARQLAVEIIDLSRRYGGVQYEALGTLFLCWADHEVPRAEAILAGFSAFGQELGVPYWHSMVAESEAAIGQTDAALARLEHCLEAARRTGELYYLSELFRLKGDVLRQRGHADDRRVAEACYQQAIEIARSQSTRLLELRSTLAYCRLLAESGRRDGMVEQLRTLYAWFTEGFETPILRDAREFLASLPG